MSNAIAQIEKNLIYRDDNKERQASLPPLSPAPPEETLTKRITALQELSLAISREIEALIENQQAQGARQRFSLSDEVRRFEIDLILRTLRRTGGNQRRAARLLGVKITTLNSKIKRYRISPESVVNCFSALDGDDVLNNKAAR
jgi:DNA-binding NtrC family response regulator